ncbi:MAG TPA: hypothetical protein VGK59_03720 [Ohtaekwangia sp.]
MKAMNIFNVRFWFAFAAIAILGACSDDDENPNEGGKDGYLIMTATEKWDAGYFTSYDDFPEGEVEKITDQSLQIGTAFGFRSFENWIFISSNAAGDAGVQKYSLREDGTLKDEGFLPTADYLQYLVVDKTHGYYLDINRSSINLQTFNPSTMERTGEVDLSSLVKEKIGDTDVEYQVIGQHTLAAKEGKLYAGITYGTITGQGFGDDIVDYIEFAVIDIATNTLQKTIKYEGLKSIGWGSSGNKMWTLGDDGALYFCSTGLRVGMATSSVIRIKAGETEFDDEWIIKATDYIGPSSIATVLVKDGTLYLELASEALLDDFSNLQDIIFDYYAIDIDTKEETKITGMPQHHYAWANEQAITEIDGDIYFWVRNLDDDIDGYYKLNENGTSATQVFNVEHDGFMWGFVKLDD